MFICILKCKLGGGGTHCTGQIFYIYTIYIEVSTNKENRFFPFLYLQNYLIKCFHKHEVKGPSI